MRIMKRILTFLFFLHCLTPVRAQEQFSEKQLADKAFERYEYFTALNLYLPLADRNKPDWRVVERVADCYRLVGDSRNAEQWYASAIGYDKASIINIYYYAEALLQNNKLKEAKVQYQAYYSKVNDTEGLRFKLATCDSAAKWTSAPEKTYKITAEKTINTTYSDWGTSFYGGSDIVFTSNRGMGDNTNTKNIDKRSGDGYLKLYRTNKDSVILLPVNIQGNKIFNGDYHAGPAVVNKTTDTAWITITTTQKARALPVDKREKPNSQRLYTRRLMLIMATKVDGVWGNFKNFPYNNISAYSVGHAALSSNGTILYFTSDMPGGEGKTDIWYCVKQNDGTWGKPVNCGKNINTKDEEAFPVTQGTDILYYASKGLPGMGGFDIFSARGGGNNWTSPVNCRYPVNSTADDFYFLTRDGLSGYFSSNRAGGSGGDDIYSFQYQPMAVPVIAKPMLPAAPLIPQKVAEFTPESLHAIIYYDLDKADIRPDAAAILGKLIIILRANPKVKIKLRSYTDARASGTYNIGLSKRRSDAAIAWLLARGITADRLSARWFGKTNLVTNCPDQTLCTESEHQLNRRTDITFDGNLK